LTIIIGIIRYISMYLWQTKNPAEAGFSLEG